MLIHCLRKDIAGDAYLRFLEAMLAAHATFSLVWREQLSFDASATAIRSALKRDEVRFTRGDRWPGTRLMRGAGKALIVRFHCSPRAIDALRTPGSLFAWMTPRFPEDLGFYDESGNATFASVTHDKEAWILGEPARSIASSFARLDEEQANDDAMRVLRGV